MVPPYTGVPKVSHQLPVLVAVVLTAAVVVLVVVLGWTALEVVIEVVIGVWVDVVEGVIDVLVEVVQDVKITTITIRQVIANQIVPLFILSSYFIKVSKITLLKYIEL
jgi:hypothetical protein